MDWYGNDSKELTVTVTDPMETNVAGLRRPLQGTASILRELVERGRHGKMSAAEVFSLRTGLIDLRDQARAAQDTAAGEAPAGPVLIGDILAQMDLSEVIADPAAKRAESRRFRLTGIVEVTATLISVLEDGEVPPADRLFSLFLHGNLEGAAQTLGEAQEHFFSA